MAIGDGGSVLTHGWFPDDGQTPDAAEVLTHGWWRVVETVVITSAPNIITFTANSAQDYFFDAKSAKTYSKEAKSAQDYIFVVDEG